MKTVIFIFIGPNQYDFLLWNRKEHILKCVSILSLRDRAESEKRERRREREREMRERRERERAGGKRKK